MDDATFDRRTIVVAALAIVGFVALGVAIAVFGAPDDPQPVLAGRDSESAPTSEATDDPVVSTTTTVPRIEIVFDPETGLGFEARRRWVYDPTIKTLRNLVILDPVVDELVVGYTEVIPKSVLDLGEFDFDPGTDDVSIDSDGTKTYRFEVPSGADEPGEVRWEVVTATELDQAGLDALAADLVAAGENT